MISERLDGSYERLRQQSHPFCVVCGDTNRNSLGMDFRSAGDGTVQATFACERAFEGYPNVLHGGVICALLDGAMTNCLFAHGCAGVTGDLNVRFCHPVAANGCAETLWRLFSVRILSVTLANIIAEALILRACVTDRSFQSQ